MSQHDSQRPTGNGLKLGETSGDSLRLAIVGYQFSDAEDLRLKYSWYTVEGDATVGGSGWGFRWHALTCDAAPAIAEWLRSVASWATSRLDADAPKAPWLIEPNLQFPGVRRDDDAVILRVELDLEFLPPERRSGRVGAAIRSYSRFEQPRMNSSKRRRISIPRSLCGLAHGKTASLVIDRTSRSARSGRTCRCVSAFS